MATRVAVLLAWALAGGALVFLAIDWSRPIGFVVLIAVISISGAVGAKWGRPVA